MTARFDTIRLEQEAPDRVQISDTRGEPPPPTLKVSMNRLGGYRSDLAIGLTGLDVDAKAELVEAAFWRACPLAPEDFDEVSSRTVYTGKDDPASNEEAVAQWCLTVKDADEQKVGRGVSNAMNELALASIPGFFAARSGGGARAFGVHRAGLVPAGLVPQHVVVLGGDRTVVASAAPEGDVSVAPVPAPPSEVPAGLGRIVSSAFSLEAGLGGFVGVLIQGFRRAAFSNEAGAGSASIAHAAARTNEPVREGMVALLEPFVDTILVCTPTGLVIVVTGAWNDPAAGQGIRMTSAAFATVLPWFPAILSVTATLFAFSTMISWSYYGEQCWARLFGVGSIRIYQLIFLVFVWAGAVFQAKAVVDFGDMMILGMAFPNLVGVILLSGKVKADLDAVLGE